jgi:hypothetical protein
VGWGEDAALGSRTTKGALGGPEGPTEGWQHTYAWRCLCVQHARSLQVCACTGRVAAGTQAGANLSLRPEPLVQAVCLAHAWMQACSSPRAPCLSVSRNPRRIRRSPQFALWAQPFAAHSGEVLAICVGPAARYVITGGADFQVSVELAGTLGAWAMPAEQGLWAHAT